MRYREFTAAKSKPSGVKRPKINNAHFTREGQDENREDVAGKPQEAWIDDQEEENDSLLRPGFRIPLPPTGYN